MSLSFWIRDFLFLPLATMRREVWWRNLSLVIAMFVFGVWHKGSLLLMMWGAYHGILLVLHRQWQEFRKRMGFEWSGGARDGNLVGTDIRRGVRRLHFLSFGEHPAGSRHAAGDGIDIARTGT
jgi:D-alanyl-lipoteichoic acid acyltransferase DltB (MBOAT superfamily)